MPFFTDTNRPETISPTDTVLLVQFDDFVPDFLMDLAGDDRRVIAHGRPAAVDWALADQPDVGAFVRRGYWVRVVQG